MLLSRDQILDQEDLKTEIIDVPEWGGKVKIQGMTAFARDRFESSLVGKNGGTNLVNIRAKLAAASIVDDAGELMFSEKDIEKLGKKSASALQRVFNCSQKLNGISDGDVEELAKNS